MSPSIVPMTTWPSDFGRAAALRERRLENGHRALHRLGAHDELGEKERALFPEAADLLDSLHETLLDDLEGRVFLVERLAGELLGRVRVAVEHRFCATIEECLHQDPPYAMVGL